jgi:hypothetical protein
MHLIFGFSISPPYRRLCSGRLLQLHRVRNSALQLGLLLTVLTLQHWCLQKPSSFLPNRLSQCPSIQRFWKPQLFPDIRSLRSHTACSTLIPSSEHLHHFYLVQLCSCPSIFTFHHHLKLHLLTPTIFVFSNHFHLLQPLSYPSTISISKYIYLQLDHHLIYLLQHLPASPTSCSFFNHSHLSS